MKRELMEILACPVCKGDLELNPTQETGAEIISGNLRCPHCQVLYPIEKGIPNLLPPERPKKNKNDCGVSQAGESEVA